MPIRRCWSSAYSKQICCLSDVNRVPIHPNPVSIRSCANPMRIQRLSHADPAQILSQSNANPSIPIQCQFMPIRCQLNTNPFQSDANLMPIWCQSDVDLMSIWRQSKAYLTPILRQSDANLMPIRCQSDDYQAPIQWQSGTNPMSIKHRSNANPFQSDANLISIRCQSIPIWRQYNANPTSIRSSANSLPILLILWQSDVNPVPIPDSRSDTNPTIYVQILSQSSANLISIQSQSRVNPCQSKHQPITIWGQSSPIWCQSSPIWCQSDVDPMPIVCQSIPIRCQSSVNLMTIKSQSCANPLAIRCQSDVNLAPIQ